ncbi:hypothetical protein ACTMTF_32185 [Nonomuraea sp. ZG12]|uniref:hypothetical protein n=1 Tax=Nonomuraea sp. ZG12 TaxID=3452207 RepID=UPI003F889BF4
MRAGPAHEGGGQAVGWHDLLTRWPLLEADLHQVYGIDLAEPDLLRRRPPHCSRS